MRKLVLAAVAAAIAVAVPAAARAGAVTNYETWANENAGLFYNAGTCIGPTVAGYGTSSGWDRTVETAGGGFHGTGAAQETYDLHYASGPPWAVTLGAPFATLSYTAHFDDEYPGGGQGESTGITNGTLTYPDGSTQRLHIVFHIVWPKDGPPRLFLVRFDCGPTT